MLWPLVTKVGIALHFSIMAIAAKIAVSHVAAVSL